MFRRLRAARASAADGWRSIPMDPEVRHYLGSGANLFFLFVSLVMFAIAWPTLPMTHDLPAYTLPVVAGFAVLPLALGWAAPLIGWAISAVTAQVIGVIVPTVNDWPWTIQVTHLIVLLVLSVMSFLRCPLRYLPLVWACATLVVVLAAPSEGKAGWAFGLTSAAVVVALLRGLVASRRQLAVRTRETKAAESETAVLQERARIARDLHDVVAHRMSMVVVMAQTAPYRLEGVGLEAAAEFEAIAGAARASLDEVRQLLGVLRVEDGTVVSAPNPGLADIADLVAHTRRAGAAVAITDVVDHASVGEVPALVVYRIVQEALANATRHAPGSAIDIQLSADADWIAVWVHNTAATGQPLGLGGAGTGITGMMERARTVGGSLVAAPTADGGFTVRAHIPHTVGGTGGVAAAGRGGAIASG
ncbi:hypothetical protein GCM10009624_14040 [Gordonia sinesedis]